MSNSNLYVSDWTTWATEIVDKMFEHPESDAFQYPVTQNDVGEHWEYYQYLITYPIDLSTIKEKINNEEYNCFADFKFDINKIFENCRQFNEKE
jgi:hypothetical protein